VIRDAAMADMPAVRSLLAKQADVAATEADGTPETLRQRQAWFRAQVRGGYPVVVAELDGVVVGFASYGSFRGEGRWPGYRATVEHTIHVDEARWGRGIGRALLESLIEIARSHDVHVMVAAVDGDNAESIAFHERLGFVVVARMPEVGRKFDRWLDLVLLQRVL